MLVVGMTFLAVSSESLRSFLETSFAKGTVEFLDNTSTVVLGFLAFVFLIVVYKVFFAGGKKDLPPGSYNAEARKKPVSPEVTSLIPFVGNFIDFAKNPLGFVLENYKKKGPHFTANIFGQKLTFLIGPQVHEYFFRPNDEYLSMADVYQLMTPVFGPGLVYDATPKRRAQQMQFMANGLRLSKLKGYVAKIKSESIQYFDSWGDSGVKSLKEAFAEVTILTASRALMGDEIREHLFKEVSRLYADLDGGTTPLSFFFPYAPIPAHKQRDRARRELSEILTPIIRARRASGERKEDILDTFIHATYKDTPDEYIPEDHVVGLLVALLFAGQHTSSLSLTWAVLHIIIDRPDVLGRIMEEQKQVLGDKGVDGITYDTLNEMTFLHACIKESLRCSPPLIFIMRRVMKDLDCGSFHIPTGNIVVASPGVAGKIGDFWGNPNDYDPDRFLDGRGEEDKQRYTNITFGGGMHGCMGQQYAYIQIKTVLSVLFQNFDLVLEDKVMPEPDFTALVIPPLSKVNAHYTRKSQ